MDFVRTSLIEFESEKYIVICTINNENKSYALVNKVDQNEEYIILERKDNNLIKVSDNDLIIKLMETFKIQLKNDLQENFPNVFKEEINND